MSVVSDIVEMLKETPQLFSSQEGLGLSREDILNVQVGTARSIVGRINALPHLDMAGMQKLNSAIGVSGFASAQKTMLATAVAQRSLATVPTHTFLFCAYI